ncbi:MAG: phospholipase D-like domain-containing protein [Alphaproteobacteria bacterium]
MARLLTAALAALAIATASAFASDDIPPLYTTGDMTVCFTSGNGSTIGADCAAVVVAEFDKAQSSIEFEAYSFTEPRIAAALVRAHGRGVSVNAILDKSDARERGTQVDTVCRETGIPCSIDVRPAIAHNKVAIIDGAVVLTGSFNFTIAAVRRNAENLLVVRDTALAAAYAANFKRRLAVSEPYRATQ